MLHNVGSFRRMYYAAAPFVAVENSRMHRYATALVGCRPTQYVLPYQHGTGHTKLTGLWLRNLPALKPKCEVEAGRGRARMPVARRWLATPCAPWPPPSPCMVHSSLLSRSQMQIVASDDTQEKRRPAVHW